MGLYWFLLVTGRKVTGALETLVSEQDKPWWFLGGGGGEGRRGRVTGTAYAKQKRERPEINKLGRGLNAPA